YAGGLFTTESQPPGPANCIAKWDGQSWSGLGSGMNYFVNAMVVLDDNLYAGGGFYREGGSPANFIAKWDGQNWSSLGLEVNGTVWALAVSGHDLYGGGEFSMAGGNEAYGIAKWDGNS